MRWICIALGPALVFVALVVACRPDPSTTTSTVDKQNAECSKLQAAKDWRGLNNCAKKLASLGNKDKAREYAVKAAREHQNELSEACDGNEADACNELGGVVAPKNATKADTLYKKANRLYKKACDGGEADACNELGVAHRHGLGVPKNDAQADMFYQKADKLYQKACDNGLAKACFKRGMASDAGTGVPKDADEATAFFDKACKLGDTFSCLVLQLPNERRQNAPPIRPDPADSWTTCWICDP